MNFASSIQHIVLRFEQAITLETVQNALTVETVKYGVPMAF